MWSCFLFCHDESKNKVQKIHTCSLTLRSQWPKTKFRKYLSLNNIRKVEFSCYLLFKYSCVSLPLLPCFLIGSLLITDTKTPEIAIEGPYYYYYCCCCYLLLQRGKELDLAGGRGDSNKRMWLRWREALGLRYERVIQDITNANNVINMQNIQNWTSSSKKNPATTAKFQLQHFLST